MGCTLQRGLVYVRKEDGLIFCSLGFSHSTCLAWVLEQVPHSDGRVFLRSPCTTVSDHAAAVTNLQFVTCNGLSGGLTTDEREPIAGIPFALRAWAEGFSLISFFNHKHRPDSGIL